MIFVPVNGVRKPLLRVCIADHKSEVSEFGGVKRVVFEIGQKK